MTIIKCENFTATGRGRKEEREAAELSARPSRILSFEERPREATDKLGKYFTLFLPSVPSSVFSKGYNLWYCQSIPRLALSCKCIVADLRFDGNSRDYLRQVGVESCAPKVPAVALKNCTFAMCRVYWS